MRRKKITGLEAQRIGRNNFLPIAIQCRYNLPRCQGGQRIQGSRTLYPGNRSVHFS